MIDYAARLSAANTSLAAATLAYQNALANPLYAQLGDRRIGQNTINDLLNQVNHWQKQVDLLTAASERATGGRGGVIRFNL